MPHQDRKNKWLALVGTPYAFPSDPPHSFDCWSLVKHVRIKQGLPCPLPFRDSEEWCVPGNLERATMRARSLWQPMPWSMTRSPPAYAMAVLSPSHVGVVVEDGVLHALCRNASVVWTPISAALKVWPETEWWTA